MHFVTFHSQAFCFGNIELSSQLPEMLCSSQVFRRTAGFAKNTFIFITCLDHSSASFKHEVRTFLLAQWIKICRPMKGTWVLNPWSRKMPTVHHNCWSPRALTLEYHTAEAWHRACALQQEKPPINRICPQFRRPEFDP